MSITQQFISDRGVMFKVERNGQVISELKGLQSMEENSSKKIIRFPPGSDVKNGDWVINPANERLYVVDVITQYAFGVESELRAYYKTTAETKSEHQSPANIFNIGTANNSVIGTQSIVTMNINSSIQEAKEQIASSNSNDKEELQQIITLLEMVANNQIPAQKGLLSKFASVIQRNSWIASPISSILLNWLLTQVH